MKKTKIRIVQNLAIFLIMALVIFGTTFFICEAAVYAVQHFAVANAEREGETPTHTANGPQTWLPSEVEAYNEAKAKRGELVAKSDIAKFLFDCGGSVTGKIVRVIMCILAFASDVIATIYIIASAKSIYRGTRRLVKWKIREYKAKKAELNSSTEKDDNIQCTTECT